MKATELIRDILGLGFVLTLPRDVGEDFRTQKRLLKGTPV